MIVKSDSCSYKLLSLKLANFVNYSVIIQMTVTYNYIQFMELIPEYNLYDYWDICCKTTTINGNTQTVNLKKLPRFFSCFWFIRKEIWAHSREICSSKLSWQSVVTPRSYSILLLQIIYPLLFATETAYMLSIKWILWLYAFTHLSWNYWKLVFAHFWKECIASATVLPAVYRVYHLRN